MLKPIILDQVLALSSLAGSGPPNHKVNDGWRGCIDSMHGELGVEVGAHHIFAFLGVDADDLPLELELLDDRDSFVCESGQPHLDGLWVVVGAAAGLAPLGDPVHHTLFGALEVDELPNFDFVTDYRLETGQVLLVSGEAVDEVASVPVDGDGLLQQPHDEIALHEGSFMIRSVTILDVLLDFLGVGAALLLLLSQQVASRQMLEFVVSDQIFALAESGKFLRSFATTWASKYEEDLGLGELRTFTILNKPILTSEDRPQPISYFYLIQYNLKGSASSPISVVILPK